MNRTAHGLVLVVLCWLHASLMAAGQIGPVGTGNFPVVRAETYWSKTGVQPGGDIALAVVLEIRSPYHINAHNAQEPFIPTRVELVDPPLELRSSTPMFPVPEEIDFGFGNSKERIRVFSGRTEIFIPMSVTPDAKPGELPVKVRVYYQACDDKQCLFPTDITETANLRILESGAEPAPANAEVFASMEVARERVAFDFFGWDFEVESASLWVLWVLAAFGGFLLNLTPCVLPLIPIKIMGLSRAAGNRQRCLLLGIALSIGVVFFWLALGTAISAISGFTAANQLFQYPAFTVTVGVIIVAMAIGMCGFFSVQLPDWIYRFNPSQESLGGSFLFGIMTAILSTPCTAPFMGAAAAWSATQNPAITLTTFAAIGVGMAIPYLLLSAFPMWVQRMPRTGPASELIKQVMGLLMLAAGAYFLGTGIAGWTVRPPDPPTESYWWLVALFIVAAGVWLAWRTYRIARPSWPRHFFGALGALLVVLGISLGINFTKGSPIRWIYFTPERLAAAQQEGKIVVLEFTAAWCLNCHALEKAVLHDRQVVEALNAPDVAAIKIDITGNNPAGNKMLLDVGRRTIPYLVVYSPKGDQVFASDAYTIDQVLAAINEARGNAPPPGSN